ncbi:MAG: 30S ribosomal protein S3 [Candidatus Micrarchaeota archaeon]|nr:30S ribosomal protein S3 [Candidatus Micrarchaeota archaeon]
MAVERHFVREGIKKLELEKFLAREFAKAGYSHCDIQRTPLSTRIIVFATKPGMIIGRGGKNIDALTEAIKEKFGIENPQLDVKEVEVPELDPQVVAQQIAFSLERGLSYIRVANIWLQRIMEAGAVGAQIKISGKLGGDMARTEKFSSGYLKHTGEPAEELVKKGFAIARTKPGVIGVQVKILTRLPKELEIAKKLEGESRGDTEDETDKGDEQGGAEKEAE